MVRILLDSLLRSCLKEGRRLDLLTTRALKWNLTDRVNPIGQVIVLLRVMASVKRDPQQAPTLSKRRKGCITWNRLS